MSGNLNNPSAAIRDYGAISSTASLPDVNFAGFSPTEFMSLSEDIVYNINSVNSSWKQLEKMYKVIGTPRDQLTIREKVHNIHTKTNTLIETTGSYLQRLTSIVRRGDKQQKLLLEKLANDFWLVVERYSATQQKIALAMKQSYLGAASASASTSAATATATAGGQSQDEQATADDRAELLQRQSEMQAALQFEQDILVDRERQIKEIEADILDVNAIMRTVSSILQAQGEQVDSIENSIGNTAAEVELGRSELAKAAAYRQRYRRKILILVAIAVIVGLIVTGIIVAKFTHNAS